MTEETRVIGDKLFTMHVNTNDCLNSVEILPVYEVVGSDEVAVMCPDGAGEWKSHNHYYGRMVSDLPTLKVPSRWARLLYTELGKIFDPKAKVSLDAIEMQGRHLEDMRRLVFYKMEDVND